MLKVCKVCNNLIEFGRSTATTCAGCIKAGFKYCSSCGMVHNLEHFSKSGNGYMGTCKTCQVERNKVWRHSTEGNKVANATSRKYRQVTVNKQKHILRTRLHEAAGTLTVEEWQSTCAMFDFRCAYCNTDKFLTMDHIVPVKCGGKTELYNIIPACQSCNSSKQSKDIIVWYTAQKFYNKSRLEEVLNFYKKGAGQH